MRLQALLNLLVRSAACAAMLLMPMTSSAREWHDTFVFDACEQRTFVELSSGDEKLFDRREHAVRAGTPVSLTVRYPRLFTSYRVLVEVQEVPEAIPFLRGVGGLPSIDMGPAETLPETKGVREIRAIEIPRATIESVLRAFLTRESATQLILQIQTDRQAIVDGARTVRADVRALHDAVEPILGEGSPSPPYDRVPALRNAVKALHEKLDIPKWDFCSRPKHQKKNRVADAPERGNIRRRVDETDQLAVNYRRIGERWVAAGVAGLVDKVIDDAERLDTRMNTFLDNLRAHEAALELLADLLADNGERGLSATTLRDRWVLDFATDLRAEYQKLRTDEELRAIAEQFESELAGKAHPHVEWLAEFAPDLWRVLVSGTATVGARPLRPDWDSPNGSAAPVQPEVVVDRGLTGPELLERTRKRLTAAIDANRSPGGYSESPDLRHAVRMAVAHVIAARSAFSGQLSSLNEAVAKLFAGVNSILANRRGSEIELSLGVYNGNATVTYRLFEQTAPEPYSVVPAQTATDFVVLSQGSGVSDDEAGATVTDAPGEGFRFVGEGMFEVHRTYQFAAFGAFTWSSFDGRANMEGRDGDDEDYSTSTWEMSYVVGVKSYLPEMDVFPGSSARWWRIAVVVGVPVNRMPGALVGVSWEPHIGMQVMVGLDPMKPKRNMPFVGVGFDSNIFATLFGKVAKIGGTF